MKTGRLMNRSLLLCVACSVAGITSSAQTIAITGIETAGNKVIVGYTLEDSNPNHIYAVDLYTSKDNFSTRLTRVTGDVGTEVKPGGNKIVWDITNELGAFKGSLTFEVRGRVFIPFVKLTNLDDGMVFKRGKNYPIVWTSGNLSGQVLIELFQGQERIWGENNVPNSGKYDWFIPGSTKKGSNYTLKFTNTKNRNEVAVSKPFTIKPKTPLLLKAGAVVVVAGGAAALASGGSSPSSDNGTKEQSFSNWPGTP